MQAASIKDVARLSGVSYKTVSRVVNGEAQVSAATRQRVLEAIATLGYRPHQGARNLRIGRSRALRLLMHRRGQRFLVNPFADDVIAGIVDIASGRGYAIMLEPIGEPEDTDHPVTLEDRRVDATIVLDSRVPCPLATLLRDAGMPAVVIANRDVDPAVGWVDADFVGGADQMVQHLLDLGHRQIAHITDDPVLRSTQGRREGYERTLCAAGIEPDPDLIVRAGQLRHEGDAATQTLLNTGKPFTAIFCVNDLTALGAIECLTRAGMNVPDDVSITGYDDIYLAQYAHLPLSTVHLPWYEMGAAAAEMVIGAVEGTADYPNGIVLPVDLRLRATTGPVRK